VSGAEPKAFWDALGIFKVESFVVFSHWSHWQESLLNAALNVRYFYFHISPSTISLVLFLFLIVLRFFGL